jgi:GT2 family glycosyltransferase
MSLGCFRLSFSPSTAALDFVSSWANLRTQLFAFPYGDQGLFCRRAIFEKVGGFRNPFLMEDVDFVRQCKKWGRLLMIPEGVRTSPQRYLKRGVLRASLQNHCLMLLYSLGMNNRRLYAIYYGSDPQKR